MGNNTRKNKAGEKEQVNIHQGRLRVLLQTLKKRKAEIKIPMDLTGRHSETIYGETESATYGLKEFLKVVWPVEDKPEGKNVEASENAINEYFRTDFEVYHKLSGAIRQTAKQEKVIIKLIAKFPQSKAIKNRDYKQQLFFSGDRKEATNLLSAFPDFRVKIKNEIEGFVKLLRESEEGFPYQRLRNHTAHRCHRYKHIEKDIFQYIKDAEKETLKGIQKNLLEVMNSYIDHLEFLESEGRAHGKPSNGEIIEERLVYKELSNIENIHIREEEETDLERIGFQNAYSKKEVWFDEYRLKKLHYWQETLGNLAISSWPEFYLEQILLAYFELNTVCAQIVTTRNEIFNEVGYQLNYSKDGLMTSYPHKIGSLNKLGEILSNYEYEANAFVKALRSDGNLLDKPLHRLPDRLQKAEAEPDQLYYSRVEKLVWEYLLFRMCDSCELNKKHVLNFYTPLYQP